MVSRAYLARTVQGIAALSCLLAADGAGAACTDLLAQPAPRQTTREIRALDLASLRDIGPPDGGLNGALNGYRSPLALSPNGKRLAFIISRPDPSTNSYCIGLALMSTSKGSAPRLLDQGGDIIMGSGDYRGVILPTGYPALTAPAWSPDGRWIAYRRRDDGVTQLWVLSVENGRARALTRSAVDIEQFAWKADSSAILFTSRAGQLAEGSAAAQEGFTGYRYDDRFVPMMASMPMPLASTPLSAFTVDPAGGPVRAALRADLGSLPPDPITYVPPALAAKTDSGRLAVAQRLAPNPLSPQRLEVTEPSKKSTACTADPCRGRFTGLWWTAGGDALLFLRREGWNQRASTLYRWRLGRGAPRRLLTTTDLISGCLPAGERLICLRENATTPARIVQIDTRSGRSALLYDPNPQFASIRLGKVQRLQWRNDRGLEVAGDLVLPPGYKNGQRLPLIVTTYRSNGFLRGGTGNEYPIHLFAQHGFAVLSIDRPVEMAATQPGETDPVKLRAANDRDWAERRSMHSAVVTGVERVIAMGVADRKRVGITGLSDGSSTVGFALINSRLFAAAAVSTCCLEPWTVNAMIGPAFARMMRRQGFPPATSDDRAFWHPGSLIRNAGSIDTPLLMQLADREYLTAIEVFAALREQGKPVDMYVFPDELHNKWQPVHRLAIYRRNLDWFRFWLRDEIDPDPDKAEQYRLWRELRRLWKAPPAT